MLSAARTNYSKINLADPELELIDPTPNVHMMFIQFDQMFFWTKLASRAVVRWSKRMYSCAGVCSYEGRGGLCDIALSEPLLKLRPRKDLVETLLHEMIHAFLFVTSRDQDRDGHGPNFQAHMHRINNAAGLKISIYHSFHEEVELYQTHWWRCNGPCQLRKPHFGIIRRTCNKPPGPKEWWWSSHQRNCGGTFIKFKEPENKAKKPAAAKPQGDITKYVTTNKTTAPKGEPKITQVPAKNTKPTYIKSNSSSTVVVSQKGVTTISAPAVKTNAVFTGKANTLQGTRVRSSSVDVAEAVRSVWANKQLTTTANKPLTPPASHGKGKFTSSTNNPKTTTKRVSITDLVNAIGPHNNVQKAVKHKADSVHTDSPPVKMKKIDDYFKTTATSLLKDIYGDNIEIAESNKNKKLIAVHNTNVNHSKVAQVDCPICKLKVDESCINSHLDECLNKDIISKICTSTEEAKQSRIVFPPSGNIVPSQNENKQMPLVKESKPVLKEIYKNLTPIPPYKGAGNEKERVPLVKQTKPVLKEIYKNNNPPIPSYRGKLPDSDGSLNYTLMRNDLDRSLNTMRGTFRNHTKHAGDIIKEPKNLDDNINWEDVLKPIIPKTQFDPNDVDKVKSVVKKIQFDKHLKKSDNFIVPKEEKDLESGFLPSFIGEEARTIKLPPVKLEPGTSVVSALTEPKCPCCGTKVTNTIDEHLEECLAFIGNDGTMPKEGASTSFANQTIVIDDDDDDIFDETQLLNATGTKLPCPCCLKMIENDDMNAHLDICLC